MFQVSPPLSLSYHPLYELNRQAQWISWGSTTSILTNSSRTQSPIALLHGKQIWGRNVLRKLPRLSLRCEDIPLWARAIRRNLKKWWSRLMNGSMILTLVRLSHIKSSLSVSRRHFQSNIRERYKFLFREVTKIYLKTGVFTEFQRG